MFRKSEERTNKRAQDKAIEVADSDGALTAGNDIFSQTLSMHVERLSISNDGNSALADSLSGVLAWLEEYHSHCRSLETENKLLRDQNKKLRKCLQTLLEDTGELNEP